MLHEWKRLLLPRRKNSLVLTGPLSRFICMLSLQAAHLVIPAVSCANLHTDFRNSMRSGARVGCFVLGTQEDHSAKARKHDTTHDAAHC